MSYKHTNKFTSNRLSDWIIHCDICGKPTWYSDSVTLEPETGKGGLLVCPDDRDIIDYGLVPYEIPTESQVTTTRIDNTIYTSTPTTTYEPFDINAYDPMSISDPSVLTIIGQDWEELTSVNWEDMTLVNWEDMV